MKPNKIIPQTLAIATLLLFILTTTTILSVNATSTLNLPPSTIIVTMEAVNGTSSYFVTNLTDVPSGYDVNNSAYPGWCVDTTALMSRSPATHQIVLYSSLNPPNGTLAEQRWDMVNYLLNHKQGTVEDMQAAIWYFVNFNVTMTPPSNQTLAWAIINDTLANGTGYTPAPGQTAAVICDPILLFPQPAPVQINIIEVTVPTSGIPEYPAVAITPLAMTAVSIALIYTKKASRQHDKPKNPT
jgi:hypothetical protein